jgi:hypothetical protein
MTFRLRGALAGAVVCALLAIGAASAPAATAPRASGTVYGGYTAQNDPLTITLDRSRRIVRTLGLYIESGDGYAFGDIGDRAAVRPPVVTPGQNIFTAARISATGTIKAVGQAVGSWGDQPGTLTYTLAGKVKGALMSGTVKAQLVLSASATAPAKTVTFPSQRWVATSRPGRVFAGATNVNQPVVVELNSTGGTVKTLRVPWHAAATTPGTTGGDWAMADTFRNLPLLNGAFIRSWSEPYTRPDGGTNTFDYALTIRAGHTKVTGSIQTKVTETDAAGTVQGTYDSGAVTFSAATSARGR